MVKKCVVCGRKTLFENEGRVIDGSWKSDSRLEKKYQNKWICNYGCYSKLTLDVMQNVEVTFKLYYEGCSTHKTLYQKFTKTIEFFEHDTIDDINTKLKDICSGYEGYEKKTFKCSYNIISIRKKIVKWERKNNSYQLDRVEETYIMEDAK